MGGSVSDDADVNLLDLQAIKNVLFGAIVGGTFCRDVNVDGAINLLDLQPVKSNLFRPGPRVRGRAGAR
jgi:hypothetical protein